MSHSFTRTYDSTLITATCSVTAMESLIIIILYREPHVLRKTNHKSTAKITQTSEAKTLSISLPSPIRVEFVREITCDYDSVVHLAINKYSSTRVTHFPSQRRWWEPSQWRCRHFTTILAKEIDI